MNIELKEENVDYKVYLVTPEKSDVTDFHIPYLLAVPANMQDGAKAIVLSNNSSDKVALTTEELVDKRLTELVTRTETNDENGEKKVISSPMEHFSFGSPVILPILPYLGDGEQPYYQQLTRECFDDSIVPEEYKRIDNQVCAICEHAREVISEKENMEIAHKIIAFGHSASGTFMQHFALIHPEIIDTLIIGGSADIIPVPFGEEGKNLGYPFGIKDFETLTGKPFDIEAYKKIMFQYYLGDGDANVPQYDAIGKHRNRESIEKFVPYEEARAYQEMFGQEYLERFYNAIRAYEQEGCNIGLKIYENDVHLPISSGDLQSIYEGISYFTGTSAEIQKAVDALKDPEVKRKCQETLASSRTNKESGNNLFRNSISNVGTQDVENVDRETEERQQEGIQERQAEGVSLDD